jgi:uncharacterized protein YbjT (DUF2867 family)
MPANSDQLPLILVTGATGYIGGRLVARLLQPRLSRALPRARSGPPAGAAVAG